MGEPTDCTGDAEDSDDDSSVASDMPAAAATPLVHNARTEDKVEFLDDDGDANTFVRNKKNGGVDFIAAGEPALRNIQIQNVHGRKICFIGTPCEHWEGDADLETMVPEGQDALVDEILAMFPL